MGPESWSRVNTRFVPFSQVPQPTGIPVKLVTIIGFTELFWKGKRFGREINGDEEETVRPPTCLHGFTSALEGPPKAMNCQAGTAAAQDASASPST